MFPVSLTPRCIPMLLMGVLWVVSLTAHAQTVKVSSATHAGEVDLVDVAQLAPDIIVEMRYAGPNNFTGAPVPGYTAPVCLLLSPAARALAQVQQDLRREGMKLKVFDCYRPARAVRHFVSWARDVANQRTKPAFYPNLQKTALLGNYIAETSGHSRGATVDLTLMDCNHQACQALEMGTPFDFFDPRANTDSSLVGPLQQRNRQRLLRAMSKHGFINYPMEWWHFSYQPEPTPETAYDVPVQ